MPVYSDQSSSEVSQYTTDIYATDGTSKILNGIFLWHLSCQALVKKKKKNERRVIYQQLSQEANTSQTNTRIINVFIIWTILK